MVCIKVTVLATVFYIVEKIKKHSVEDTRTDLDVLVTKTGNGYLFSLSPILENTYSWTRRHSWLAF